MYFTPRFRTASVAFAAGALLLTACGGGQEQTPQQDELSPTERLYAEAGVSVEPGLASCDFNNATSDYEGDGSGQSPYPALGRAELREEEDAYVVTYTGDFFDPEALLTDDANLYFHVQFSLEGSTEAAPVLMTEYRDGELDWTGTFLEQDTYDQETNPVLEKGRFTATYPKHSPHLVDFQPDLWVPRVYFDEGESSGLDSVSFDCGDGRSWEWEPAA